MKPLLWHDYLTQARKIPREVLISHRFTGRIRVDVRANAIFPHFDGPASISDNLCGFEKRNWGFKGFADLGEKGLWMSNDFPEDRRLVFSESGIDGLSYEALFRCGDARYRSIAGGLNPKQPDLILQECKGMLAGAEVISITHADANGESYAVVIAECAAAASLPFRIHRPSGVKDWNDFIQASNIASSSSFPAAQ
jgi:hypothetical protein